MFHTVPYVKGTPIKKETSYFIKIGFFFIGVPSVPLLYLLRYKIRKKKMNVG